MRAGMPAQHLRLVQRRRLLARRRDGLRLRRLLRNAAAASLALATATAALATATTLAALAAATAARGVHAAMQAQHVRRLCRCAV